MAFEYDYAVVSKIPESFSAFRLDRENNRAVALDKLQLECTEFVETLRKIGVDIFELDAEERHPECVKVDDTGVIINGTALMCQPNGTHRQGEVNLIRCTLKGVVPHPIHVVELNTENAQVEGSDVLFTGQEIIVGISEHTNENGAQAVARAFPEYATSMVQVRAPFRSLKDAVGVAGINVLVVGNSESATAMLEDIKRVASYSYDILTLPEDHAVNMLYINRYLLHLSSTLIPESIGVIENKISCNRIAMHLPNLLNAGVSMTKLALLIGRFSRQRNIASTIP